MSTGTNEFSKVTTNFNWMARADPHARDNFVVERSFRSFLRQDDVLRGNSRYLEVAP